MDISIIENIILKDFEEILNTKVNIYSVLKEDNLVILINDKYILKQMNKRDYNVTLEFEAYYKFVKQFRKSIHHSDANHFLIYDYIEEDKYVDYNKMKIFNQIYDVVREERKYESNSFGYKEEDNKTWFEFLNDEVTYTKNNINDSNIDLRIIEKALKIIKKEKIEPYLIHGDLGVHNFVIKDKMINVIDPMVVVGDYLYDFYYAVLSDYSITDNLDIEFILSYFDRKEKYKKALFIVTYYIRMGRAFIYNKPDYAKFLNDYKYLSLK